MMTIRTQGSHNDLKLLKIGSLDKEANGLNSERIKYSPKRHEWICSAPRASDLRRQRLCSDPTSVRTVVRKIITLGEKGSQKYIKIANPTEAY
jgi:hypothetical protein